MALKTKESQVPSTIEQLSPTRVKLTISIPFADLAPAIDKAYKEIARNVNLPGFRRGHVPAALIDQRYGRLAVLQEAVNAQLPDIYNQAVADNNLHPLAQPEVNIDKLEDGETVELTAEVDVRPDFTLPDPSDITVRVDSSVVSDDAVNERLDLLRQRFATFEELDRPAAQGDVVVIDIAASQDGVDVPDADASGVSYVVGSGGLVDGLDDALTGMEAGTSKEFKSTLVGGPHVGEEADITVSVQLVQRRELPPVNDEFAQMVSEYDTVAEMMAGLRDGLERIGRVGQLTSARDQVIDAIIDQTEFEIPQSALDAEVEGNRQSIEDQLARAGLSVERYLAEATDETATTPDEFWSGVATRTERALRARLILDQVVDDEQIDVTQDDLSEFIVNKSMEDGITPDEEAQHMMEHNHMTEWVGEIRRGKAVDMMMRQAQVKDSDGRKIDLSLIARDGSLAEPKVAASSAGKSKKKS